MNVLIKRRQLIMAAIVVVLGAAVFVNWYYTNSKDNVAGAEGTTSEYVQNIGEAQLINKDNNKDNTQSSDNQASKDEYFAQIKLNRANSREDAMDNINTVLDGAEVDSKLAASVAESLDKLVTTIKLESDLETLISAKLSCDCVVISGEETVQIVVEKGVLNDTAVLQIKDIVLSNSKIPAEGIKIMEAG